MAEKLEDKDNDAPIPGQTRVMSGEKVYELCIKGTQTKEARAIFEYLRGWRCESNKSGFAFDSLNYAA